MSEGTICPIHNGANEECAVCGIQRVEDELAQCVTELVEQKARVRELEAENERLLSLTGDLKKSRKRLVGWLREKQGQVSRQEDEIIELEARLEAVRQLILAVPVDRYEAAQHGDEYSSGYCDAIGLFDDLLDTPAKEKGHCGDCDGSGADVCGRFGPAKEGLND